MIKKYKQNKNININLTINDDQLMGLMMIAKDQKEYWQDIYQQEGLTVDLVILSNWADIYRQLTTYKPPFQECKRTLHLHRANKYKIIRKEMK